MSIGLILILIFVVALILGPIRMMQPSPAQKNREKMRLAARNRGVHFSMRNIPQQADQQEKPSPIPVYFLPPSKSQIEKGWMLVRAGYEHEINFQGWWAWQNDVRPTNAELEVLQALLSTVPDSVRALSSGSEGVCVFWEERGGDAALESILGLLTSLKGAIESE